MYFLPKILKRIRLSSKKNCKIDKRSKTLGGCTLLNVIVDKYTYIGMDNTIVNAEIGAFCSIAGSCMIGGGGHPLSFVSTSPVFCAGKNVLGVNFSNNEFEPYAHTIIGNDVWIGGRCLIKAGIKIGNGAVIGMGSVVTHDIPDYEVWAGNPAKFIKKRFDDTTITNLLESEWWKMNDSELKKYGESMNNPSAFLTLKKENK